MMLRPRLEYKYKIRLDRAFYIGSVVIRTEWAESTG